MLFDSHCHLTDDRFASDLETVLERAWAAGLVGIVTVGADAADSERAADLARRHSRLSATAGIHPHVAAEAGPDAFERIRELAARPEVVALGETGLDYHYENSPRAAQRSAMDRHFTLAAELDMPLVVHAREADADTAAALRSLPGNVCGVLHCFTGGRKLLEAALAADWYVSFAGIVSFSRYADAELLRAVPDERLLIETDSPYLAPVPMRGRRNEPAFVEHVASAAARLRGAGTPELAERTALNAREFYRLQ